LEKLTLRHSMPFRDGAIVRLLTIQRNLGALSAHSQINSSRASR
jgi:hypothetical protein